MPQTFPETFEETVTHLEMDLEYMHVLYEHLPVPTLLYDKDDNVVWCNKSMLNLFWGAGDPNHVRFRAGRDYFGKHVTELFPQALYEYVIEQNKQVAVSRNSQYEDWQDDTLEGTVAWKVLRFPAGKTHVGVVLFPKNAKYLGLCDHALTLRAPNNGNK